MRDEGGLPTLIGYLASTDNTTLANTALCLGELAWSESNLPSLRPAVLPLIDILQAHSATIAGQNAAIALARMAKDSDILQTLRDKKAIEMMHHVSSDMARRAAATKAKATTAAKNKKK
jgi:hypothetical protein